VRILSFVNHSAPGKNVEQAIEQAFEWGVDIVVAQGTGSDWGPYWLGSGRQVEANQAANVRPYVRAALKHGVPFVFSFGLAGADDHLDQCLRDFDQLCKDEGWELDIAVVRGEIDKQYLLDAMAAGQEIMPVTKGVGLTPYLARHDVEGAERIVALMGPEPIMAGLAAGKHGVITGRALDVGLFMALPMARGIPTAVAAHAGKLLECGGFALSPNDSSQPIWAVIDETGCEVRSPNPAYQATVRSLIGHTLYERAHPTVEENPGGALDLGAATYEQLELGVRCEGAAWIPAPYTVLLEGASSQGFRAITMLGVREPELLRQIRDWTGRIEEMIASSERFAPHVEAGRLRVHTRIYGLDGVLGELETHRKVSGHEALVVLDVVADELRLAEQVAYFGFMRLLTSPYPDRKTTAGNAAAPFMPVVIPVGEVFTFSIQHLLPLADPLEPFAMSIEHFPGWQPAAMKGHSHAAV
jgi:hypothetical protein